MSDERNYDTARYDTRRIREEAYRSQRYGASGPSRTYGTGSAYGTGNAYGSDYGEPVRGASQQRASAQRHGERLLPRPQSNV